MANGTDVPLVAFYDRRAFGPDSGYILPSRIHTGCEQVDGRPWRRWWWAAAVVVGRRVISGCEGGQSVGRPRGDGGHVGGQTCGRCRHRCRRCDGRAAAAVGMALVGVMPAYQIMILLRAL